VKEQQTYREEMLQGPCGAEPTDSWSTATCDSKKGTTVNLLVHLLLVGLLLLSAVGTNANETAWARVLSTYVNDAGQVDFTSLSNSTADLNKYIKFIGNIGPESHPARFISRGAALAHHLNAYNALSMHAVLGEDIPESLGGFNKY
jgi:hypothetical protein